jgi:hypothetical protein
MGQQWLRHSCNVPSGIRILASQIGDASGQIGSNPHLLGIGNASQLHSDLIRIAQCIRPQFHQ